MKKIITFIISVIILMSMFVFPTSALDSVIIEQVSPVLPSITATLKFRSEETESISQSDIFAKWGGETLTVTDLKKYNRNSHETTIYFLVDTSSSIPSAHFTEIRKKLLNYSNNLTDKEKLVLITFGSSIKTVLSGEENKDARAKKIQALKNNEGQTNLYDAVKRAVDMSQSDTEDKCERSFAVVVSDGINVEYSGGNTSQEVRNSVSGHGLPIYALCVNGTSNSASELGSFARNSGGDVFVASGSAYVSKTFDSLVDSTRNVYLVSMLTESNKGSDGSKKNLMIRTKDKSANVDVKATRWIKDDEAPRVKDIEISDDGKVYVYYSENVLHADNYENFTLKYGDGKQKITFTEAEYVFTDTEYYTILTPKMELPKADDYQIEISNVTDSANEENPIDVGNEKYSLGDKSVLVVFLLKYWWIILIVLAIIAILVIVIAATRKSSEVEPQPQMPVSEPPQPMYNNVVEYQHEVAIRREKHHIMAPQGKPIKIRIICGNATARLIDTTIVDKLVVGRSEKCDIYLDDMKMSRVHFEIVNVNGEFWINDLGSANGTLLNNVKIIKRRKLRSNDEIIAGLSKFRIVF